MYVCRNTEVRFGNHCWEWKSNTYYIYQVFIFCLSYPAYKENVPYYHLCPVRLYHIFPRRPINGMIFEKKNYCIQNVLFSYNFCLKTFLILRKTEQDMIKTVYRSSCNVPVILLRINET